MLARLVLVFTIFGVFALSATRASTTSNKWVQPLMVEELDNIRLLDDALLEISNSAEGEAEAEAGVEAEGENEIEGENENENELLEGIDQEIAQTVENEVAAETANEAEAELAVNNENETQNQSEDTPIISFSAEDVQKLENELEEELSSSSFTEVSTDLGISAADQLLVSSPVGILPDGHEDHHGDALQDAAQRALQDSVQSRTIMEQSETKLEGYQKEVRELIAQKGHPAEMADADLSALNKLVDKLKEHRMKTNGMRAVYEMATKRTQRLVEAYKRHIGRVGGVPLPPKNAGAAVVAAAAASLVAGRK